MNNYDNFKSMFPKDPVIPDHVPPFLPKLETKWTLLIKTVLFVLFTAPILTLTQFCLSISEFKASLGPYEQMTLDWSIISSLLWQDMLTNLLGYSIIFIIATFMIFLVARVLGGTGHLLKQSFELSLAYLKIMSLGAGISIGMLVTPYAGIFVFAFVYLFLRWLSMSVAEAHSFSLNRGFLASLPLVLILFGATYLVPEAL